MKIARKPGKTDLPVEAALAPIGFAEVPLRVLVAELGRSA
jgi:hypothetical protein